MTHIDRTMAIPYYSAMINLNINEAKAHLSSYLARAAKGEKIVICKRNKPVAEILPIKAATTRRKRPIGLAAKDYPSFTIDNKFFDPLPEDILDAFTGQER